MSWNPWTWLVGAVGKLAASAIALVVLAALIVAPFWFAWHAGYNARDAEAKAAEQTARIETLQELLAFGDQVRGLVGDYVLRRGQGEIVYRTLKQEVPNVVTVYRSAPGAAPQPLPRCVFTRGFVRVWNAARDVSDDASGTGGAGEAAQPADSTNDDPLVAEGVDQQAVLGNHVENAELTHNDRLQCEALIQWAKALPGGKR